MPTLRACYTLVRILEVRNHETPFVFEDCCRPYFGYPGSLRFLFKGPCQEEQNVNGS